MDSTRKLREELAVVTQVLTERMAEDSLFQWEPLPKQKPFIDAVLREQVGECWFVAANRSGKSDAGAFIDASLARFGQEPRSAYSSEGKIAVRDRATSGWVVSLDFPSSRDIIQPKIFDNGFTPPGTFPPFIPQREIAEWRQSDQILKLKNGSIIGFKSADSGRLKFQGAGKDWVHFDEEPPKDIYNEATIRIQAQKTLRVYGTCTILPPEGKVGGVTWVYTDIIRPFVDGKSAVPVFGASMYDNIHLSKEEIERAESRYPVGSIERRIRIGGEWLPGMSGARAYGNFDRRLHLRKQPKPYERWPLCWAWDFNVEPMISIVGQRDGKLFRTHRTLALEEANVLDMVQLFVESFPHHYGEIWVYGDATGKNRNAHVGVSDYQQILNAMRTYGSPVRLKVPEANPFVPDRINAVNHVLRDENGASMIEIDPEGNEELIADLEQVQRDGRGGIKKTFNRQDPYFRRTHSSDALGYWIVYEEPVRAYPVAQRSNYASRLSSPSYVWTH